MFLYLQLCSACILVRLRYIYSRQTCSKMCGLASGTPSGLTITFIVAGVMAETNLIPIRPELRLEQRSNNRCITSTFRGGQPGSCMERITLYKKNR